MQIAIYCFNFASSNELFLSNINKKAAPKIKIKPPTTRLQWAPKRLIIPPMIAIRALDREKVVLGAPLIFLAQIVHNDHS